MTPTTPPAATQSSRTRLALRIALGLWIAALAFVAVHVWLKPESNTLYKVFHSGGERWLKGQNLYPKVDEYIYSPFAAAFFAPFALLPDAIAGILWRALSMAAYLGAFAKWLKGLKTRPATSSTRIAFAWILLLPLSVGDIYNGQANPLVIGLLMFAILACRSEQWFLAAFSVGFATYFKVYPIAIGLLLAVLHPRKFPLRLLFALAAIFALSLILQRPSYALQQYPAWIASLRLDPRRTQNYFGLYRDFWLLLRVLRVPISVQGWALLQAASGIAVAACLFTIQRRGASTDKLDFLLLSLGTCWMLLFGPATESSTYVILAPPLILAGLRWSDDPDATRNYLNGALVSYTLLLGSQMFTSWGHQYQNAYTHLIQPVGAMVLTVTLLAYAFNPKAELADNVAPH
jgi:hypothetical protein